MPNQNKGIPFPSANGVLYFSPEEIMGWFDPDTGECNPEIPEDMSDEDADEFADWVSGHAERLLADRYAELRSEQIRCGEGQPEGLRCFEDLAALFREVKKLQGPVFTARKNKVRVLKFSMRRNNARMPRRYSRSRSRTRRHGSGATCVRSSAGGGSSDGGESDQGDPSGPHEIIPFTSHRKRNALLQRGGSCCCRIPRSQCGAGGWAA